MSNETVYDVAIIGGGLAGLSTAIVCARQGQKVILFEKEQYPFHKVCGEYISLESKAFLQELGLPLEQYDLPQIDTLELSSPNGNCLTQKLPLGGIGISRFKIDDELAQIARQLNVFISEGNRVQEVKFENDHFVILSDNRGSITSRICCGAFGKRSNLDVKWKRPFIQHQAGALNNFIGIKYHAALEHPRNVIALHNFRGGYCGISSIENGKTCICYLTSAANLKRSNNNIREMEQKILSRNPFLRETFENAASLYDKPLTISQISFDRKEQVVDHVIMLGDAAGLITPLCGNGMSMALQSGKMVSAFISQYLSGKLTRKAFEQAYTEWWKSVFSKRLFAGRIIQSVFGKEWMTNTMVATLKPFPRIVKNIIQQTHGKA
ncbi:MAG: NAD(P)/FAD-dependent oxidoreductase [Flavitalea sp.]